jgi:hypothetical protein
MKRAFNWTLNVIAAVSAIVIIWQTTHRYLEDVRDQGPKIGSKIQIGGRNVSADRRPSAILALSTYCGYCRSSAPFYRAMLSAALERGIRLVAVLPEDKETYGPLLPKLGLSPTDEISQVNLESIGVRATPTIVLVDENSTVRKTWVGKLSPDQEKEVFLALGLPPQMPSSASQLPTQESPSRMSILELKNLMERPGFVIVDSRERAEFKQAHIKGALNIPLDEFDLRAPHEVPRDQPIAVVCPEVSTCATAKRQEGIETVCDMTQRVVAEALGFKNAKFVPGDLCTLQSEGIPIEGNPKRRVAGL